MPAKLPPELAPAFPPPLTLPPAPLLVGEFSPEQAASAKTALLALTAPVSQRAERTQERREMTMIVSVADQATSADFPTRVLPKMPAHAVAPAACA
jgi:hypothetical protein